MSDLLRSLKANLKSLGEIELVIENPGNYPDKRRTLVAHVAKYQNDGTDRGVKPSHFVERAERQKRAWKAPLQRAVFHWLFRDNRAMHEVGRKIRYDINAKCDRIRTGRLFQSFRFEMKQRNR